MTYMEEGFCNRAQSKMVCSENNWCSHVTARDAAEASTTVTSALGTAAETARGGYSYKGPFTSTGWISRTELQYLKDEMESEKHNSVSRILTALQGKKTHLAFLNNLLHNVMICD